jgi:putative transposase
MAWPVGPDSSSPIPHHITQRGNNRQDVFFHPADNVRYLQILAEHALRSHLRVIAWCLMTNHVHLIVIPASADSMARAVGQAHSQYSLEQNCSHRVLPAGFRASARGHSLRRK